MVRAHHVRNPLGTAITDPTGRTVTFSPLHMRQHLARPVARRDISRGVTDRGPRCAPLAAFAALVVVMGAAGSAALASAPAAGAANWSPVHASDFPDPSILQWQGVYYGFATQSFSSAGDITNIQVSTSLDGVNWTPSGIDALPTLPSWAEVGDTWAPSVAHSSVGNDFVMYYTATETSTGDQCIGVATSTQAAGPYTDPNAAPVVCDNGVDPPPTTLDDGNWGGSIDPDIFTNNAGNSFLLWKSDGNHMAVSTPIRSVPLTSNLLAPAGQPTTLLWDDEPWQSNIVEGPDMVETQTSYYLFYAGSDEGASTYAVGWAGCPSGPSAACTEMSTTGPLLATSPGMSGPGGPDVFTLPSGQLVMAFAAWQGSTIGYLRCGIRPMYLATLTIATPAARPRWRRRPTRGRLTARAARRRRTPRPDTGRSARTAASSRSGPHSSTVPRGPCGSTSPWSAWRRHPTARATGSWPATVACSPTATLASTDRRAASC